MTNHLQPSTTKFIDPLTDYGFRYYFGSEPRKDILIEFLNDLFDGERHIEDLHFTPTEYDGDEGTDKRVLFDLNCRGRNNEHFIIEMQRVRQEYFKDRALYYTSRLIQRLLSKGEETNRYELPAVYLIGILEFRMDDNQKEQYFHDIALRDKENGKLFYNKFGFKFLELSNFEKEGYVLESSRDKWMYLLKHMHKMDRLPAFLDKRVFQKIFSIAEVSKLSKEERMAYEASLKAKWDTQNAFAYVEKKGREEGLREGRGEEKRSIARAMKADGIPVVQIGKFTGLNPEEIERL